jgi:hypothetical protein
MPLWAGKTTYMYLHTTNLHWIEWKKLTQPTISRPEKNRGGVTREQIPFHTPSDRAHCSSFTQNHDYSLFAYVLITHAFPSDYSALFLFCIFLVGKSVRLLPCLCRPFFVFKRCLDSNLELPRYQLSHPSPLSVTYILITPSLLVFWLLILYLCPGYSSFPCVLITQALPVDYSSLTCTLITPSLLVSWLFYLYFVLIIHCLPESWFLWLHDDLIFGSHLRIIWK